MEIIEIEMCDKNARMFHLVGIDNQLLSELWWKFVGISFFFKFFQRIKIEIRTKEEDRNMKKKRLLLHEKLLTHAE